MKGKRETKARVDRRHDSTFPLEGARPGTRVDRRDRRKRFAVRATDAPRATTRTGSDRHRPPRPPGSGSHSIPLSGIRGAHIHFSVVARGPVGQWSEVGGRGGTGTSTARPRRRRDETARRAAARARDAVRRGVPYLARVRNSSGSVLSAANRILHRRDTVGSCGHETVMTLCKRSAPCPWLATRRPAQLHAHKCSQGHSSAHAGPAACSGSRSNHQLRAQPLRHHLHIQRRTVHSCSKKQ